MSKAIEIYTHAICEATAAMHTVNIGGENDGINEFNNNHFCRNHNQPFWNRYVDYDGCLLCLCD